MNAALIDAFQCNSCSSLSLWVLQTNLSAINFYEKFGFESDGQCHEELYEGTKITDVRMIKLL
ncbi:GNAT family N-acetyltransferase [Psychrobacter sp. SZ93C1]|nr:GNAT family N-acetyltransferase [Psychrobacter sp. SZ93C1]